MRLPRPRCVLTPVLLAVAGPLLLGGFTQPPVSPEHTLRYTRERGGSCTVMIPYYGPQALWIGRVAGSRTLDVSADRVFDDRRAMESCFFLEEDCQRWVMDLRGAFPEGAGYAYCQSLARGGLLYGEESVRRGGRAVIKP